ncbi:MAG: TIGR02757 family protein [Nitrospirae bacterium]|nr:TIGR02757 family protein [Nitrospirota bacterium]
MHVLNKVLKRYGSLEAMFKKRYKDSDLNIGNGLIGFVGTLLTIGLSHPPLNPLPSREGTIKKDPPSPCGRGRGRGFLQFLPSPEKGSACKRMNLFLRWMIRDRDIDFGIWKGIPKNKLIIPLDTHIARISKCLSFTKRKSQDWKMAVEITESLKEFDSEDPLKYDFALCHQGISRVCSKANCKECSFQGI